MANIEFPQPAASTQAPALRMTQPHFAPPPPQFVIQAHYAECKGPSAWVGKASLLANHRLFAREGSRLVDGDGETEKRAGIRSEQIATRD